MNHLGSVEESRKDLNNLLRVSTVEGLDEARQSVKVLDVVLRFVRCFGDVLINLLSLPNERE
jgi:hypothetical protein